MAFIPRRRQLAAKTEVTFGTYEAPAAADIIEPVYDLDYSNSVEMFERDLINEALSRVAQVPGERSASISFSTELKGSGTAGTAPAHLSVPLKGCGMSETLVAVTSATYAPISSLHISVSMEIRETDDTGVCMRKRIAGGRGTWTMSAEKGQPVLLSFEYTGKYLEPDQVGAPLTPSPGLGLTPNPFLGVTFSFHAVTTLLLQAVEIDFGNEVSLRNDINDASGNIGATIVSRSPTGSINPEQALIAAFNPWTRLTAATEGVMSFVLGSGAGNIVTFSAPKVQIISVEDGDRENIVTNDLSLQFNQSSAAGNDEMSLAFT